MEFVTARSLLNAYKPLRSYHRRISTSVSLLARRQSRNLKSDDKNGSYGRREISEIVNPVPIKPVVNHSQTHSVEDMSGSLTEKQLMDAFDRFSASSELSRLASEYLIDSRMFSIVLTHFRTFCLQSKPLPIELHVTFSDIIRSAGHPSDLFPHFLSYAHRMYPHLTCLDELKKVSDLSSPFNWYPEARGLQRKVVYHSGPTNSGKTYHALERYRAGKSGVYCGPLKLLAAEVYYKTNDAGIPCDLVTGEDRQFANADMSPASHLACTVEMTSTKYQYEVAVIDEIQMVRDVQRGWAWTRALLGVVAEEVHICGEPAAIDIVRKCALDCGDEFEVRHYKRKTPLTVLNKPISQVQNLNDGDCVVCFNKNDIFSLTRRVEALGRRTAVIYGSLPPGTKLAQAAKFNDPSNPCKILVATDAIGMGLNLSIKRVIFNSLTKPTMLDSGETEVMEIASHVALQIGGRAGRYGTQYPDGEVTTLRAEDLPTLKRILRSPVEAVEQAGLHPTFEQIEMFAYYLPNASLSNLIEVFLSLCVYDNRFFLCHMGDFLYLADSIQHIPMSLKERYIFCLAPISRKQTFAVALFNTFARQFSNKQPLTIEWLGVKIGLPFEPPMKLMDLVHLEGVFDVLDMYLWLGYRFEDMFPDMTLVRDLQLELDAIIEEGVANVVKLIENAESKSSYRIPRQVPDESEDASARRLRRPMVKPLVKRQEIVLGQLEKSEGSSEQDGAQAGAVGSKGNLNDYTDMVEARETPSESPIAQELLDQGIVTPKLLEKLKKELLKQEMKRVKKKKFS